MANTLDELLVRIRALEEQVEQEYLKARTEFAKRSGALAAEFIEQQRRHKVGLLRFIGNARILVLLTAPVIYAGWPIFILIDLFVTVYQAICFPVYGIPKVKRSDFLVFDRELLPYLNWIERINCLYCSYGNGVTAYLREVASRTEQYWCPIKHARRIHGAHDRYAAFFEHGDGEAFRQGIARLRRGFGENEKQSETRLTGADANTDQTASTRGE